MSMRRAAVLMAASMLVVATGVAGCAMHTGAGGDPIDKDVAPNKIRATYDAKEKSDATKRIVPEKVRKDDSSGGKSLNEFDRCTDMSKCKVGYPVEPGGNNVPVLDESKAIDDTVLFVSDYYNPGRACVCYGNKCYCN